MRELTLLDTGYLTGGLLLCLVLPLLMSLRAPQDAVARRSCMKTVWSGQALLALSGLVVLASGPLAPYAAAFGLMSCMACAMLLFKQSHVFR